MIETIFKCDFCRCDIDKKDVFGFQYKRMNNGVDALVTVMNCDVGNVHRHLCKNCFERIGILWGEMRVKQCR